MFKLRSLSTKIVLAYLALTLFLFIVTTLSFNFIVRQVVMQEAAANLRRQGDYFARFFANNQKVQSNGSTRPQVQVAGHMIDGYYVLVNGNGVIQLSNLPDRFPAGEQISKALPFPRLIQGKIQQREYTWQDNDYLVERVPVSGSAAGDVLYMLAELQSLDAVRRGLFALTVRDSLLALAGVLLLAWFFGRRVALPLQELRQKAEQIAGRNFDVRVDFKTGDEVEELGHALNSLASQLGAYDQGQRHFFQSISHELRTPLMSIRGYAEGVRDGVFTGAEADQGLDVIIKESQRLQKIVDDILFLSRLKSPREVYQWESLDLLALLREVCTSLGGLAEERGVTIRLQGEAVKGGPESDEPGPDEPGKQVQGELLQCNPELVPGEPVPVPEEPVQPLLGGPEPGGPVKGGPVKGGPVQVWGDREKLRRVWINILGNCLRYARSQVAVTLEVTSGDWREVQCRDDGPGFQEQDLKNLFQEFYKGKGGQSGLGMAIAQEIVFGHRGEIMAQNHQDGGAEIVVCLPSGH